MVVYLKHKLSISISESTVLKIFDGLRGGKYRNKSHLVEVAVNKYLESEAAR